MLAILLTCILLLPASVSATTDSEQARLDVAVASFYELRKHAPAWTDSDRRQALLDALAEVERDGLDPDDYHLSSLRQHWSTASPPPDIDTERLATRAAIRALSHLLGGKLDPRQINPDWNFQARQIDTDRELRGLSDAIDQNRLLDHFAGSHPAHPFYHRLKAGLHWLRRIERSGGWPSIGPGPTLRLGQRDPRVGLLRRRLSIGGYQPGPGQPAPDESGLGQSGLDQPDPELFDQALEQAVKHFQREHRLTADGAVGNTTLAELDRPIEARIDQMRVNLERARWLLHETSREFLLVDIAGFKASYFVDGEPVWHTRIQVGQPFRKTPEYRSLITHIDLNPTWTVPPTIFRKDILPKLRRDLGYLDQQRMQVLDAHTGQRLDPTAIDWSDPRGILIRQDAGPGNALGRVAIRFANPYAIYLHDTPHSAIFSRDERAVSSGCIRVEHPLDLVERLLADPEHWSRERIEAAIAQGHSTRIHVPRAVTLLLAYWSVDVHADDRVSFRRDIYARDAIILNALNQR